MISFRLLPPLPTAQRSRVVIVYKAAWATVGAGVVMEGVVVEREAVLPRNEPRGTLMRLLTYCIKSSSLFYCHNRSPAYFLDASVSCCLDDLCRVEDGARGSGTYLLPCCTYQRRTTRLWWKACLVIRTGRGLPSIFRLIPNSTRAILAGDLWCGQWRLSGQI